MHNGTPSQTDATTSTVRWGNGSITIVVRDGIGYVSNMDFGLERRAPEPAHITFGHGAYESISGMRTRQRLQAEGELELERLSLPGRPQRTHFPEACRASRPQPRRHAVPRAVIPVEWDRAMRARWLR